VWVNTRLFRLFLSISILSSVFFLKPVLTVNAQAPASSTGSLIITVTSGSNTLMVGQHINYTQISHDFLIGYSGPLPATGIPEAPYGFNLELNCIPWAEIEPQAGNYPHNAEESGSDFKADPTVTTGNDCLIYFAEDAQNHLPEDLVGLKFDDLLARAEAYLKHAVRYETTHGINLFVIKEPAYPTANLLDLSVSQWHTLVKLACQVIRAEAPRAKIVIEVIPQYLPSLAYKPYTFLDDLIRDGVGYDGIMIVFSPPVATRFTKEGYPSVAWVNTQVDTFSELGKRVLIRFSGITPTGAEVDRQAWLDEIYKELYDRPMVLGTYWDEILRFPAKLADVKWSLTNTGETATSEITIPMLAFIKDRTSTGTVDTDANGQADLYGYAGDYEITVEGIPGVIKAHIYRGEERRLDLSIGSKEATPAVTRNRATTPTIQKGGETEVVPVQTFIIMGVVATILAAFGFYSWKKNRKKMKTSQK